MKVKKIKKYQFWISLFSIFLVSLLWLMGCGTAETAFAPKNHIQPKTKLRHFSARNYQFTECRVFLWQENDPKTEEEEINADIIYEVKKIGEELDSLEDLAFPLWQDRIRIEKEISKLEETLQESKQSLEEELDEVSKKIFLLKRKKRSVEKKFKTANTKLITEEEKPAPDPVLLEQLRNKVQTLQNQLSDMETEYNNLSSQKSQIEEDLEKADESLKPLQEKLLAIAAEQIKNSDAVDIEIAKLDNLVHFFKPSTVGINFKEDGSILVSISEWTVSPEIGERDYSTESVNNKRPTIGNVSYEELGGKFTFEVYVYKDEEQTQLIETYFFDIARTNYDDPDGHHFFGGEIKRTVPGETTVRKGIAKFVQRN